MTVGQFIIKHFGEKLFHCYQNIIGVKNYMKANPKDKDVLLENKRFQGKYQGKRCFILGNGPSLGDVSFELLADEYIFTVNNVMKIKDYKKLKSNFHLWMDGAFFGMRKDLSYDMKAVKRDMAEMLHNEGILCFAPIEGKPFVDKLFGNKVKNMHYVKTGLEFYEDFKGNIDLTGFIPAFTTVVQYAVIFAAYMGFTEIYLLGCDSTNIKSYIDQSLDIQVERYHAYGSETDDARRHFEQLKKTWKMDQILYDQYLLFRGYRYLNTYCRKRGIKLFNLTKSTLIDAIPQKSLEEILATK